MSQSRTNAPRVTIVVSSLKGDTVVLEEVSVLLEDRLPGTLMWDNEMRKYVPQKVITDLLQEINWQDKHIPQIYEEEKK